MDAAAEFGNLVLSRKRNESIEIGDDVTVTVAEIRGDKVRLAVNAPKHIRVHRREVAEAIRREMLDTGSDSG